MERAKKGNGKGGVSRFGANEAGSEACESVNVVADGDASPSSMGADKRSMKRMMDRKQKV